MIGGATTRSGTLARAERVSYILREMANSRVLTIPATELKNKTGQAIRAAEAGARVVVTRRGRPVAILIPARAEQPEGELSPYEQAWGEIEHALERSRPQHRSWREALDRSRRRR